MVNKLEIISNFFEGNEIRSIWNNENTLNYKYIDEKRQIESKVGVNNE